MKKQYIIPVCTTVSIRTVSLLTASENEYSNDQGLIHFSSTEVDAEEGD
jgi:hypothetical protein